MSDAAPPRAHVRRRTLLVSLLLVLAVVAAGILARPMLEVWLLKRIEGALSAVLVAEMRVAVDGPLEWRLWPRPGLAVSAWAVGADRDALVTVEQIELELDGPSLRRAEFVVDKLVFHRPVLSLGPAARDWFDPDAWLAPREIGIGAPALAIRELSVQDGLIMVGEAGLSLALRGLEASLVMPAGTSRTGRVSIAADVEVRGDHGRLSGRLDQSSDWMRDVDGHLLRDFVLRLVAQGDALEAAEFDIRIASLVVSAVPRAEGVEIAARATAEARQGRVSSEIAELRLIEDSLTCLTWKGEFSFADESMRADGSFLVSESAVTVAGEAWAELETTLRVSAPWPMLAHFDGRAQGRLAGEPGDDVSLDGRLEMAMPRPGITDISLATELDLHARWWPALARAEGVLGGRFDGSMLDGEWSFDAASERPLHVAMAIDRLDLDAYLGEPSPDTAPDLAPWRSWPLSAELRLGELRWQGLVTTDARLLINRD